MSDKTNVSPQDLQDAMALLGEPEKLEDPCGFESPNYTQIPNDLFDKHLPGMDEAELRVVLYICRQTYGYHRTGAKVGIAELARKCGLSYGGVVLGARAAEKRGLIRRTNPESKTQAEWEIVEAPSASEGVKGKHPQPVREEPSTSEGQVRLNKGNKDIKDSERKQKTSLPTGSDLSWLIAAGVTNEEMEKTNAKVRREREVTALFEKAMGYNPLPWWDNKKLAALLKFLLEKTPEEITVFAQWARGKYSGASPAKILQDPLLAIHLFPQAFTAAPEGRGIVQTEGNGFYG